MIEWLKDWANQIIVAIVIAIIFELIIPKGKNKKYRGTIYERIRIHTDDLVSARVFLCCFHDHHGL